MRTIINWINKRLENQATLVALSLGIVCIGLAMHVAASHLPTKGFLGDVAAALPSIGTTIVSVGLVAMVVRSSIWNEAIERTLSKVRIETSINASGLTRIEFFPDVNWKDLFQDSEVIEILAISSRSFLSGVMSTHLKSALARPSATVKIILANPFSTQLMDQYDERFGQARGSRSGKSKQALSEFLELIKDIDKIDTKIQFFLLDTQIGYSYYRFDSIRIIAPYLNEQNQRDPAKIPLFFFNEGSVTRTTIDPDIESVAKTATKFSRAQLLVKLGEQN